MKVIEAALKDVLILSRGSLKIPADFSWKHTRKLAIEMPGSTSISYRITCRFPLITPLGDCTFNTRAGRPNWFRCCRVRFSMWPWIYARDRRLSGCGVPAAYRRKTNARCSYRVVLPTVFVCLAILPFSTTSAATITHRIVKTGCCGAIPIWGSIGR